MDFEMRCLFREQLTDTGNYRGLQRGSGETVEVDMQSGRVGLYEARAKRVNYVFEDTGQRHWSFRFLSYKEQP